MGGSSLPFRGRRDRMRREDAEGDLVVLVQRAAEQAA
jgi:hypothetical protein